MTLFSNRPGVKIAILVAALTAGAFASPAHALVPVSAITTPAGLVPGDKFFVVFITNAVSGATSPLASTYDAIVAADALGLTYHGLPVTVHALVSTADGAIANQRFDPSEGIYLIDGTKVADDGADLWDGTLQHAINLAPGGGTIGGPGVWTGSDSAGNPSLFFSGPQTAVLGNVDSSYGALGDPNSITAGWSRSAWAPEDSFSAHYYGYTELLSVPEPASLSLLALGGVVFMRRRQRSAT